MTIRGGGDNGENSGWDISPNVRRSRDCYHWLGEEHSSMRVAIGPSTRAASPLRRQDGMALETLVTDKEFVFTGSSLTEHELAQAIFQMPLNDKPPKMDSTDVPWFQSRLVPG
ncbi:hypothetical protein ACLKA7_005552 [Drosophila subpalustris]